MVVDEHTLTSIQVTYNGKSAHASVMPYEGINALVELLLCFLDVCMSVFSLDPQVVTLVHYITQLPPPHKQTNIKPRRKK